jgi:hypothetical protein
MSSKPSATATVKPSATSAASDIQYFDKLIAKKADIRRLVMPEYFTMPDWWVPTVKMKAGESLSERTIRDWSSWRKQYARTFREQGLKRIDGVLFYAAKITPGVFVSLVRAGKRAYCLEYARQFGTDETGFRAMIGLDVLFPAVMESIRLACAYHKVKRSDKSSQADIDSAHAAWVAGFDRAHAIVRAHDIPTKDADAPVAPVAAPVLMDARATLDAAPVANAAPVA